MEVVAALRGGDCGVYVRETYSARLFGHSVVVRTVRDALSIFGKRKRFTGSIYNLLAQPAVEVFGELDVVEAAVVAIATDAAV